MICNLKAEKLEQSEKHGFNADWSAIYENRKKEGCHE